MYGTALRVRAPSALRGLPSPRVVLRQGAYNGEIATQLLGANAPPACLYPCPTDRCGTTAPLLFRTGINPTTRIIGQEITRHPGGLGRSQSRETAISDKTPRRPPPTTSAVPTHGQSNHEEPRPTTFGFG